MIEANDPRHGTARGYWAGCKESCCRGAIRAYAAQRKAQRIARGIPQSVHGSVNGYNNFDCRCDACQIASLKHRQEGRSDV